MGQGWRVDRAVDREKAHLEGRSGVTGSDVIPVPSALALDTVFLAHRVGRVGPAWKRNRVLLTSEPGKRQLENDNIEKERKGAKEGSQTLSTPISRGPTDHPHRTDSQPPR